MDQEAGELRLAMSEGGNLRGKVADGLAKRGELGGDVVVVRGRGLQEVLGVLEEGELVARLEGVERRREEEEEDLLCPLELAQALLELVKTLENIAVALELSDLALELDDATVGGGERLIGSAWGSLPQALA